MAAIPLVINILYALLLAVGGLVSIPPGSTGGVPDGVLHGSAYGLQTALLFWFFVVRMRPRRALIVSAVCATLFGAMVETMQILQPARTVEFRDLVANEIGVLIVGTVILLLGGRSRS